MSQYRACLTLIVATLLGGAIAPSPASAQGARRVIIERTGYRLARVGETVVARAGVLDAAMLPQPDARIAWRVEDTAVVSVNTRGVLRARAAGYTRLWAISGRDSAAVMVVVAAAPTATRTAGPLRFDAAGTRQPFRLRTPNASGTAFVDFAAIRGACRSLDEGVAALTPSPNPQVVARAAGVTWIRCVSEGTTDSLRVEVAQRAARIAIDGAGQPPFRVIGDTFRLATRATNAAGAVVYATPTWSSTNVSVVMMDLLSVGLARAIGPGEARLIAQTGSVADTLTVSVRLPPVAIRFDTLSPFVGDTVHVTGTARDEDGAALPGMIPAVRRSTNPAVVAVVDSTRIRATGMGRAWVVVTAGRLTDSIQVAPRVRPPVAAESAAPVFTTAGDAVRADTSARAPRVTAPPVDVVTVSATASLVDYEARIAGAPESYSGFMAGVVGSIAPLRAVSPTLRGLTISAALRGGTLSAGAPAGDELQVTEATAQLSWAMLDWLAICGGYTRRAVNSGLAIHHWQFAHATVAMRTKLLRDELEVFTELGVLPWGNFTGQRDASGKPQAIQTSTAVEAGVQYRLAPFALALSYSAETIKQPVGPTDSRQDRFSALRIRISLGARR